MWQWQILNNSIRRHFQTLFLMWLWISVVRAFQRYTALHHLREKYFFSYYDVTLTWKTAFLSSDFYLICSCQQSYPSQYKSIKKPRVPIFSGQNGRMTVLLYVAKSSEVTYASCYVLCLCLFRRLSPFFIGNS